jgi:hypothetical protein
MSLVSQILMADWYSSRCALTWKMKGTKFSRLLFQLRPKTLPTAGIDVGLLLPTPTLNNENGRRKDFSPSLLMVAKMLPTPTAQEFRDSQLTLKQAKDLDKGGRVLRRLGTLDILEAGKTSQLNPRFVAEMMGFPPNWTELPFLNGETSQSKDMETP